MPVAHERARAARAPRHRRVPPTRRALRGVALTTTALMVAGVSGAAAVVAHLNSNVDHIAVDSLVQSFQPTVTPTPDPDDPNAGTPVNILLLGSDQRDGENAAIGGDASTMASDTAIVAHISADRQRVELVSIPRDSMVEIPSCLAQDGSSSYRQRIAQFNSAFTIGWDLGGDLATAAACVMNTVQTNTGVPLDHVAVVDMAGFQRMIDAVGGVDICIPEDMSDRYTGLNLTAGNQHLDGTTALQFARARHVSGTDGSDLTRIGNQQRLLSAVMTEVLSRNVLTNATQLLSFMSAATSSLTLDEALDLDSLVGLAYSARNVRAENITFMTIPVAAYPEDPNRVIWTDAADQVWENMAMDIPITQAADDVTDTEAGDVDGASGDIAADDGSTAGDGTDAGTDATGDPATDGSTPDGTQTREAGREAFTGADVTAVCG